MRPSTAPLDCFRLIEGEIQALRRNVERDLVSCLRDKIGRIVREALMMEFADPGNDGLRRSQEFPAQHVLPMEGLPRTQVWQETPQGDITYFCQELHKETPVPSQRARQKADDIRLPGTPLDTDDWHATVNPRKSDASLQEFIPRKVGKIAGFTASIRDLETVECDSEVSFQPKKDDGTDLVSGMKVFEEGPSFESGMSGQEKVASRDTSTWIKKTQRRGSGHKSDENLNALQQFALSRQQMKSGYAARTVSSDAFDYFMCVILLMNGVLIGIQADWQASNPGQEVVVFLWADRLFCIAFVSELALRLYVHELSFYVMPGWPWSYFDTVVVSMQVIEEIWIIAEGKSAINVGFFKLLKMGRLLRMVRMVRLIPELKSMVYLILASMSSFLWSCVLLSLLVYVVAVYMTMMAADAVETTTPAALATDDVEKLRLYWGSIGSSVMSVWWSISGGQDWADLVNPLIRESNNNSHNVVYSMFIAFATMVIMNLVTGVFVEGAQRLKQKDRDKDLQRMAQKTFKHVGIDQECLCPLTKSAFEGHLFNGDFDDYLQAVDLTQESACDLFDMLDEDGDGTIDFHEFVDGCIHLARLPRVADIAQVLLDVRKEKDMLSDITRKLQILMEKDKQTVQPRKTNSWGVRATAFVSNTESLHEV